MKCNGNSPRRELKKNLLPLCVDCAQMLHVCNISLHLPWIYMVNVAKYTIHGYYGCWSSLGPLRMTSWIVKRIDKSSTLCSDGSSVWTAHGDGGSWDKTPHKKDLVWGWLSVVVMFELFWGEPEAHRLLIYTTHTVGICVDDNPVV